MISKILAFILLLLLSNLPFQSISQYYEVELSPIKIEGLGGLQSYAVGTFNGEWLIVGGRLDGLHRREPFASFSLDGRNKEIIVVNPRTHNVWRTSIANLPTTIAEQLASTNMQFYQDNELLLCTGGYAYSEAVDDHITFPYMTIIDIPATIKAVKTNSLNASLFHQEKHELFRVTGGALNKIDDVFYLVGGHSFMGRYNPMGPDHGPGFEQKYTNEIRRFSISKTDSYQLKILESIHDEMHLRRRDYNLTPFLHGGERGLTVNSGVFKNTSDLPWLYPVTITKKGHVPHENFNQFFNHYHCAYLPIFDSKNHMMHTLFFGGIAQFYQENGIIVQDNDVPFVNTITDVSQDEKGIFQENILSNTLPGYLGAGSIFIYNNDVSFADNDILDGSQISNEFKNVGYIFGGIQSSKSNIFWINTGNESIATETIFKVSIRKNPQPISPRKSIDKWLQFYPNPEARIVRMSIEIDIPTDIDVIIEDENGNNIHTHKFDKANVNSGRNYLVIKDVDIKYGAFYYTVIYGKKKVTRKVIWNE